MNIQTAYTHILSRFFYLSPCNSDYLKLCDIWICWSGGGVEGGCEVEIAAFAPIAFSVINQNNISQSYYIYTHIIINCSFKSRHTHECCSAISENSFFSSVYTENIFVVWWFFMSFMCMFHSFCSNYLHYIVWVVVFYTLVINFGKYFIFNKMTPSRECARDCSCFILCVFFCLHLCISTWCACENATFNINIHFNLIHLLWWETFLLYRELFPDVDYIQKFHLIGRLWHVIYIILSFFSIFSFPSFSIKSSNAKIVHLVPMYMRSESNWMRPAFMEVLRECFKPFQRCQVLLDSQWLLDHLAAVVALPYN